MRIPRTTLSYQTRSIIAVSIGNALEWFEIVIYGYFAAVIAVLFFPAADRNASLLLVFGTFGLTFLIRPLGAVFLGAYADRHGRKAALQLSIVLMMFGSAAIALAPTYQAIGIAAPVILLVARIVQGIAVGGEFGSATAFLAEQDPSKRGYYASWQFASQGLTAVLATASGAVATSFLSVEQIETWGWRLPFLLGLLIGPVGYYIRRNVEETADFREMASPAASPVRALLDESRGRLLIAIGLVALGTVTVYTILFLPTYATRQLGISLPNSFAAGLLTGLVQLICIPPFGALSDRVGRTCIPIIAAIAILLSIYPLFGWLAAEPSVSRLLLVQGVLGALSAAYLGAMPAMMSELFPVHSRTTGLSLSYALGVAVFGGFAPFVHTWLIGQSGSDVAPSYYVAFAALISLLALAAARNVQLADHPKSLPVSAR